MIDLLGLFSLSPNIILMNIERERESESMLSSYSRQIKNLGKPVYAPFKKNKTNGGGALSASSLSL